MYVSQSFKSFVRRLLGLVGWLVVWRINVDLAIFQPYLDLEAGDNQSLKIQVARPGIEPRSSCSASQELNHSATTAPRLLGNGKWDQLRLRSRWNYQFSTECKNFHKGIFKAVKTVYERKNLVYLQNR